VTLSTDYLSVEIFRIENLNQYQFVVKDTEAKEVKYSSQRYNTKFAFNLDYTIQIN